MSRNPYRSPSYEASLDEQRPGPGRLALEIQAARRYVGAVRICAIFLTVGIFVSVGLAATITLNSKRTVDSVQLVTLLCIPAFLTFWTILQYRANLFAVTFTGVTALAMTLGLASITLTLLRSDCEPKMIIGGSIGSLGLGCFLIWPILLAIEAWSWWLRGLDPGAIVRGFEQSPSAAHLPPSANGTPNVP